MAAVQLVPASQREGGATLGSVVNHTYTDGKDNDLIHWLPNQLAHNPEKRSTLMQLEAVVSEYVASNEWRYVWTGLVLDYRRGRSKAELSK